MRTLRADVVCGTERIGSGESRVLRTWLSLHTQIPIQVEVPVTPAAVACG